MDTIPRKPGRPQSAAEKAKRSATLKAYYEAHPHHRKGKTNTADHNQQISNARHRDWSDPDKKAERVKNITAAVNTPEARAAKSAASKGKPRSPKQVAALAAARKKSVSTPEAIEKTAVKNRGGKHTPQRIAKASAACKAAWAAMTPEERTLKMAPSVAASRRAQTRKASALELSVGEALTTLGIAHEHHKMFDWWEVDYYLTGYGVVLEVDGAYWHDLPASVTRDRRKNQYFMRHNIPLIRIPEKTIHALGLLEAVKLALLFIIRI